MLPSSSKNKNPDFLPERGKPEENVGFDSFAYFNMLEFFVEETSEAKHDFKSVFQSWSAFVQQNYSGSLGFVGYIRFNEDSPLVLFESETIVRSVENLFSPSFDSSFHQFKDILALQFEDVYAVDLANSIFYFAFVKDDRKFSEEDKEWLPRIANLFEKRFYHFQKESKHIRWSGLFESVLNHFPMILSNIDSQGFLRKARGSGLKNIKPADWSQIFGKFDLLEFDPEIAESLRLAMEGTPSVLRKTLRYRGRSYSLLNHFMLDPIENGEVLALSLDISERISAKEELAKLTQAVEQGPVSVVILDSLGKIEYVNECFVQGSGFSREDVLLKRPEFLLGGTQDFWGNTEIIQKVEKGETWFGEWQTMRKDGTLFWEKGSLSAVRDAEGFVLSFIAITEDISRRKDYEARILHQTNYDALTNLPNRHFGVTYLDEVILQASLNEHLVALLFVDLDNFKKVNETMGHAIGDLLLKEAGKRLQFCIRSTDVVARFGSDEFFVILPSIRKEKAADIVAQKILQAFSVPFHVGDKEIFLSASLGITISPNDGIDSEVLLRNADSTMNYVKRKAKNNYLFFTSHINTEAFQRFEMEGHLHRALEKDELRVVFQPILDLKKGKICGAEALLRWKNPKLGMISPIDFIPIAEVTGLIKPIGEWVLRDACKQIMDWRSILGDDFHISVNTSVRQLKDDAFVDMVRDVLEKTGLPSSSLELEVTEGILLDNELSTTQAQTILEELHNMGILISIDDFGTGYSSLSYLYRFPFQQLKIDRSFVQRIDKQSNNHLVLAILSMAQSLHLEVTGEGVETIEQFEFFYQNNCHRVQGYLISKPLEANEFIEFAKKDFVIEDYLPSEMSQRKGILP